MYVFEPVEGLWRRVAVPELPALMEHTTTVVGDCLYIFGGLVSGEATNSLYILDPQKAEISLVPADIRPPLRSLHSAVEIAGTLVIFGGRGSNGTYFNDVWTFGPRSRAWSEFRVSKAPSPRCGAVCIRQKDTVIVWGGTASGGATVSSAVHVLDVRAKTWKEIGGSGAIPSATSFASFGKWGQQLFVYGGELEGEILGGLYSLDLDSFEWNHSSVPFPLPLRSSAASVCLANKSGSFLFVACGKTCLDGTPGDETLLVLLDNVNQSSPDSAAKEPNPKLAQFNLSRTRHAYSTPTPALAPRPDPSMSARVRLPAAPTTVAKSLSPKPVDKSKPSLPGTQRSVSAEVPRLATALPTSPAHSPATSTSIPSPQVPVAGLAVAPPAAFAPPPMSQIPVVDLGPGRSPSPSLSEGHIRVPASIANAPVRSRPRGIDGSLPPAIAGAGSSLSMGSLPTFSPTQSLPPPLAPQPQPAQPAGRHNSAPRPVQPQLRQPANSPKEFATEISVSEFNLVQDLNEIESPVSCPGYTITSSHISFSGKVLGILQHGCYLRDGSELELWAHDADTPAIVFRLKPLAACSAFFKFYCSLRRKLLLKIFSGGGSISIPLMTYALSVHPLAPRALTLHSPQGPLALPMVKSVS